MNGLKIGITNKEEMVVTYEFLASQGGSGTLDVFGTPFMIAFMELAALHCVSPYLPETETTVGTNINVNHIAPCTTGDKVYFTATLKEIAGNRLLFDVRARTKDYEIGYGTHERFIVNSEKFLKKLQETLNKNK